jgi:hypothetical protein
MLIHELHVLVHERFEDSLDAIQALVYRIDVPVGLHASSLKRPLQSASQKFIRTKGETRLKPS